MAKHLNINNQMDVYGLNRNMKYNKYNQWKCYDFRCSQLKIKNNTWTTFYNNIPTRSKIMRVETRNTGTL